MKIFLLFSVIFFLQFVSAQNISVTYNSEVDLGDEFIIKIKLTDFPAGVYDVKFDTSSTGGNIARVLNNGTWKSNVYYVNDIISNGEEKSFTLKIEDYVGEINFMVKIRDSSDEIETFSGYVITILQASGNNPQNSAISNNNEEQIVGENSSEINETAKTISKIISEENSESEEIQITSEVIKLNSESQKDIKSENSFEKLDKNKMAFYGLVIFSVALAVLFLLKNRTRKNELV